MNKVLITGATGFIGYELARQLHIRGLPSRLLVRRPLRSGLLSQFNTELIQGDLESPASLVRAVQGVDTVIHLGARAIFEEYALVRPTIVEGSIALMKSAIGAGAKTFVFASSLLVYDGQNSPIDEHTPASPRSGYGRAKLEAEEELGKLAGESGVAFAAIRLPHVYGARDLMFNQVRRGRVFFPGNGRNSYAHMHVEDAAKILLEVAVQGWAGVSPVADDCAASWNEFFGEIRKYYPSFQTIGVPKWLASAGTNLLTLIRRIRKTPSLYTPEAVRNWNLNYSVKQGILWNQLGIKPKYLTICQGIPAALDECIAFRWTHPIEDRRR
ncbi:MAG: NAD-dependent epimerase/dehydratase family protein [Deltaproteobacteria bacterium]|nr:NAD-dependent epimerase/dehydratase family protein [Deltaproteobacteria bacterium]